MAIYRRFAFIFAITAIIFSFLLHDSASALAITTVKISQTAQDGENFYIFFNVTDEGNNPVENVSSDDVQITLGTDLLCAQTYRYSDSGFATAYVFAVDISKSLSKKQFEAVQAALGEWINAMDENDYAAIVTFGEEISILSDFSSNSQNLLSTISAVSPTDNKTQLYNGLAKALDVARRQSRNLPLRRIVVVLSDGIDDYSASATLTELTSDVAAAGVPLYVVGIISKDNEAQLSELGSLARISGGELYPAEQNAISGGYDEAYQRIEASYVAVTTLPAEVADGSERALNLNVTQDGISVEDNRDVRIKAFEATMAATPESSLQATWTPDATSEPTADETAEAAAPVVEGRHPLWIIIAVVFALVLAGLIFLLVRRSRNRERQREIDAKDREKELLNRLRNRSSMDGAKPTPAASGGKNPKTVKLPSTEPCEGNETVVFTQNEKEPYWILTLTEFGGTGEANYTCLLRGEVTLGRLAGENTIILNDVHVSGRHCSFAMEAGGLYLRDLGSTNGTFILENQKLCRVDGNAGTRIKNADVISVGSKMFEVSISGTSDPQVNDL